MDYNSVSGAGLCKRGYVSSGFTNSDHHRGGAVGPVGGGFDQLPVRYPVLTTLQRLSQMLELRKPAQSRKLFVPAQGVPGVPQAIIRQDLGRQFCVYRYIAVHLRHPAAGHRNFARVCGGNFFRNTNGDRYRTPHHPLQLDIRRNGIGAGCRYDTSWDNVCVIRRVCGIPYHAGDLFAGHRFRQSVQPIQEQPDKRAGAGFWRRAAGRRAWIDDRLAGNFKQHGDLDLHRGRFQPDPAAGDAVRPAVSIWGSISVRPVSHNGGVLYFVLLGVCYNNPADFGRTSIPTSNVSSELTNRDPLI